MDVDEKIWCVLAGVYEPNNNLHLADSKCYLMLD